MKVYLRINNGIKTRKINIPNGCLLSEFKVPYLPKISLSVINSAQDIMQKDKVLVFRWDGKSKESSEEIPILDLIEIN